MAAETAVIQGLGIVFFGLAWIGFKLNQSEDEMTTYLGVMIIALSLAILQTAGWVTMQIALNEGTLSYLGTSLVEPIMWTLNIVLFLFWFVLLFRSLIYMTKAIMQFAGKNFGKQVGN